MTELPDGMRFRLDVSDREIEAWLDSRGLMDSERETARSVAAKFRDNGIPVAHEVIR